jgi:hypothetical protein
MRKKCYPSWVANGKLAAETAAHRIAMIEQAIEHLDAAQPQQQSMF